MIYTCDNCHYTFVSEENVSICPKCKKQSIDHTFGTVNISISALRLATKREIDIYNAQMDINVEIPMIESDKLLHLFCKLEEENGIVFAKIGKSKVCNLSKGVKYPYEIGLTPYSLQNSFTFEPIDIVYKHLHYGDELVIFSFKEMLEKHMYETEDVLAIAVNDNNKRCFQANMLYVKEIVPLTDTRAIDFIVPHLSEDNIDSVLLKFYEKGETYYEVTRYLENQLRNRFPAFTRQHILSGDVKCTNGFFRKPKYERKIIEIDFVKYKQLYNKFQGNRMPVGAAPIEIDDVKYINVKID